MACSAARKAASGPFWLTAPRPTTTLPKPGLSTMRASNGGDDHSDGIDLLDVVHEVEPEVRGAPASSVAKMPGWPSVGTFVAPWKPASRNIRMVSSQPSFMPRFSAAMEGCESTLAAAARIRRGAFRFPSEWGKVRVGAGRE